jgi:hypothetical protein
MSTYSVFYKENGKLPCRMKRTFNSRAQALTFAASASEILGSGTRVYVIDNSTGKEIFQTEFA